MTSKPDNQNISDLAQRAYEAWRDTSPDGDSQWPKWKAVAAALTAPAMLNGVDAAGVVDRALEYLRPHLESGTFAAPDWAIQLASILTCGDGCGTPATPTAAPAGVGNSAEDRMHRHRDPYANTPTAAPAGEAVAKPVFYAPARLVENCHMIGSVQKQHRVVLSIEPGDGFSVPFYTHPPAVEAGEVDRVRELLAYIAKYAPEWKGEDGMVVALALHDRIERALSPPTNQGNQL